MSKSPKRSPKFLKSPVIERDTVNIRLNFHRSPYDITINEKCLKGYELKKYLAEGAFGIVYQACNMEKKCNYAIKFQQLDFGDEANVDNWLREIKITGMLSIEHEIGPKFLGAWLCLRDQVGIIVSELWDGQLVVEDCPSKHLIDKLQKQIDKINDLGYVHGDILQKNILVKKDKEGKIIDLTLTDFGSVKTIKEWKKEQKEIKLIKIYYDYHLSFKPTRDYYEDNQIILEDVIENPLYLDRALMYYFNKYCNK
jgi:serine/threonine protein kinase